LVIMGNSLQRVRSGVLIKDYSDYLLGKKGGEKRRNGIRYYSKKTENKCTLRKRGNSQRAYGLKGGG